MSSTRFHDSMSTAGLSYGILSALDPEQRKAAETLRGQVMIHAGPGAGKTRTLTHRIAHLVTSKTARPEECLAILYTNGACAEMTSKLKKMLGKASARVQVLTWGGLGQMILSEHRATVGLPRGFRFADFQERKEFALKALQWPEPRVVTAMSKLALNKRCRDEDAAGSDEAALRALFAEWREHEGWLDEEDFLCLSLSLLEGQPEIAAAYRARFEFISVDEAHDMDPLSYQMVRCLAGPDGNLCAAGDPHQSIRLDRGADSGLFAQLQKDYPFMHTIRLTRNYRCREAILKAAERLMSSARAQEESVMTPHAGGGGQVRVYQTGSERAEAEWIAQSIEKKTAKMAAKSEQGLRSEETLKEYPSLSDFGVFYRTAEQEVFLREAFEQAGIPFKNHTDAASEKKPEEFVTLRPLHETKGLEFQTVFIAGCEEGLIPFCLKTEGSQQAAARREEERRLFYVGMTRAAEHLVLTHTNKRRIDGQKRDRKPSAFLKDIAVKLKTSVKKTAPVLKKAPSPFQLDLF